MNKPLMALCSVAALAITATIPAPASAADETCDKCAAAETKVDTTYKYKTVEKVKNVTQYKDVDKTKYVKHVSRIVTVTRVQPVTRVNVVTRVHNRTVILRETQNVAQMATLPTRTVTTAKTIQVNHPATYGTCNCK